MHSDGCNYLSMLGLKLNHVSKRGHWWLTTCWWRCTLNPYMPYSRYYTASFLLYICWHFKGICSERRCNDSFYRDRRLFYNGIGRQFYAFDIYFYNSDFHENFIIYVVKIALKFSEKRWIIQIKSCREILNFFILHNFETSSILSKEKPVSLSLSSP